MTDTHGQHATTGACRNCRRPVRWVPEVHDWLHEELPRHAHEPITCPNAYPVNEFGPNLRCTCGVLTGGIRDPRPDCEVHRG